MVNFNNNEFAIVNRNMPFIFKSNQMNTDKTVEIKNQISSRIIKNFTGHQDILDNDQQNSK